MSSIVSIVEGDGEVAAVPLLLRRLGEWLTPEEYISISYPIRVRRDRFLNNDQEFSRILQLAANKCGCDGWILILLDADDDCPKILGQTVKARAAKIVPHVRLSVVFANREYEAWFLAAAESIARIKGVELYGIPIPEAELPRNAKGWVKQYLMKGLYGETTDQPKLTMAMDLEQAHSGSRSFRKLCGDFSVHIAKSA